MQVKIQAILVETSEEVRLQLVQLMHSILTKAPRLIQAFASDVASILVAATFDTHPEVLLVGTTCITLPPPSQSHLASKLCTCCVCPEILVNFAEKLLWESRKQALNSLLLLLLFPPCHDVVLGANGQETFSTLDQFGELMGYKLKPVGKQLVRVVQVSLSHNHCRVRVAALKAIRRLLHPPNFLLLTSLNLLFFKYFFQRRKKHGKKKISNLRRKSKTNRITGNLLNSICCCCCWLWCELADVAG